ncbi:MAG: hypothetical protein ACLTLQ_21095 [[Clostridium] scindens]
MKGLEQRIQDGVSVVRQVRSESCLQARRAIELECNIVETSVIVCEEMCAQARAILRLRVDETKRRRRWKEADETNTRAL